MPSVSFDRDLERIASLGELLFMPPRRGLLAALWIAALAGFALWGYDPLPGLRFPLVLGLASATACILARPVSRAGGGDFVFMNALFLSLADVFLLAIVLKLGADAALALGLVMALDLLVFATLAGLRSLKAAIPAAVMPLAVLVIWKSVSGLSAPPLLPVLADMGLAWALCGTFFVVISRPMRRIGLDFLNVFARVLGDYAGSEPSRIDPFASAGVETEVPCQTIVIERSGSRDAILVPGLHPGPLASLGGDLPARLRLSLAGTFQRTVFLHTCVDHARNPAGLDAAVAAVSAAALRAAGREPRPGSATPFRRAKAGSATATGLRIGGLDLVFTTFAPEKTDDLSAEAGSGLLSAFAGEVVLVDGHNSLGPERVRSRSIAPGDPRLDDLTDAIASRRLALDAEEVRTVEIGISERVVGAPGIGRCSVVVFRAARRTSAVVVFDTNNLPAGAREDILRAIEPLGIEIGEVATTDAHFADVPAATRDGWKGAGRTAILEAARDTTLEALADLRPARVRYGSERIPLRTWGPLFERIVRAVPETARLGAIAGTGLLLLYLLLAGLGARFLR